MDAAAAAAAQAAEASLAPTLYTHSLAGGRLRLVLEGRKEGRKEGSIRKHAGDGKGGGTGKKEDLPIFSLSFSPSLSLPSDRVHSTKTSTATKMIWGEGGLLNGGAGISTR